QLTLGANLLQLAFGQGVGVRQKTTDDGALAVIDVADDHDVHPLMPVGPGYRRTRRLELIQSARQTCLPGLFSSVARGIAARPVSQITKSHAFLCESGGQAAAFTDC